MKQTRRNHNPEFKAKVALEAVREQSTITEICRRHKVHATQVNAWKRELLANLGRIFDPDGARRGDPEREGELLKKIGELTVERDFLSRGLERFR
jgi:transposase